MKANQIYMPIVLATAIVLGMYIGSRYDYPARPIRMLEEEAKEQKIRQIINYIDYDYVDDVNTDSLLDLTIKDMLHRLDPHSTYIAQQDVQATEESISGQFEGIGIEFQIYRDSLTVVHVVKGGPAEKYGLEPGDRILSINDVNVVGDYNETESTIETLRGPSGTDVDVSIYRRSTDKTLSKKITRGAIPLYSIDISYMINDTVGFIKVNRFSDQTSDEFARAMRKLKSAGMQHLILDLRDNPGGLLRAAEDMADAFLPENDLIVYTQDRNGDKDLTYATSKGSFEEGKVFVLVNENSASAAEIVAGALQDNDRATIIGRRTFGKGLVQEEMRLSDGSRMRLTTSRYYTPTGRSIQKSYEDGYAAYQNEYLKRMENGELFKPDSSWFDEDERFITKGGKVVYGGGGIMPDIFVPFDSTQYSNKWLYYNFSPYRVDRFAFRWVDAHRSDFSGLSVDQFLKDWQASEEMYLALVNFLSLENDEPRIDDDMKVFIYHRLKSLIGRNVYGAEGYYPVIYETDPTVVAPLQHWGSIF